tara:strand:- start:806 stop:1624 length:819 start_codon:yes stop_codon:yes gene_type:complete
MEDNLEKVTIHLDTKNAEFVDNYEFYVDILDDIKNVIYIKTLKTEIYTTPNYKYTSKYDGTQKDYFENGDYIYVTLNNYNRINVLSKEVIPLTKDDMGDDTTQQKEYPYNGNGPYLKSQWDANVTNGATVLFNAGKSGQYGNIRDRNNLPVNFKIKERKSNLLKYYDAINIVKSDSNLVGDLQTSATRPYYLFKNELSGTSCGPNDTNTLVVNPIEPELKRFTVNLWYVNEDGRHEKLELKKENEVWRDDLGIFRVVISFTIYYKRKKITRV